MRNLVGFIVGIMVATAVAVALASTSTYSIAKFQAGDTQATPCLMYGMQTNGTIVPIQVDVNGVIAVNQ